MNKTSLKLSARDASSKTGYSTSYIADLCRANKIIGEQIDGKWIIDEASLDNFIHENIARKKEYATHLANIREKEYRQAQKSKYGLVGHLHNLAGETSKNRLIKKDIKDLSIKGTRLHKQEGSNTTLFHSALASGVALALAFICMFSAYGTALQVFSKQPVALNSQASVFVKSAYFEHKIIATSKVFSSTQILKSIAHSYDRVGEISYKLIRNSLNKYHSFVLGSGNSALAISATTRDYIVGTALSTGYVVQDMAYVPIRVYTNTIYALVRTAPHIIDVSGRMVLAIGNSIMKGTNTGIVAATVMYKKIDTSTQNRLLKYNVDEVSNNNENIKQKTNIKIDPFSHLGK